MPYVDIEREIEAKIIRGLRRIFEFDDEFRYNVNDEETGVIITPDFPSPETPFKSPHIVVTNIGFQHNTEVTFNNNFYKDYAAYGIQNYGSQHIAQLPYSVSIICLGEYDISRNLANRLFYYVSFRAYEYLNVNLKLNIRNVGKTPTSPKEQYPEKTFQTAIDIQGITMYMVSKTPFNYLKGNKSVPMDRLGKPFDEANVDIDNKPQQQN